MRRQEREIKEPDRIIEILRKCDTCRIGMIDQDRPYVVPMSFGFTNNNNVFEVYFHGACEGKKIDILKENPSVCLEFDCACELVEGKQACGYSMHYQSVIAYGQVEFLAGEEKVRGLNVLMGQYSSREDFSYPEKMLNSMVVYKVVVDELTAKEHS